MVRSTTIATLLVSLLLVACGGSGGGASLQGPAPAGANYTPGVAYLADAEVDERYELFTAALDGSQFLKVSGAIGIGGSVHGFAWSPNRALLAYLARPGAGQPVQLFVVAPTGGAATQVSTLVDGTDEVGDFAWSPDSSRLAFREFRDGLMPTTELWSVTPTGAGLASLSVFVPLTSVSWFAWSPDSARVAYVRQGASTRLWVAPGQGGVPVEASQGVDPADAIEFGGAPGNFAPFQWAPDSARIAFVSHHVSMTNNVVDLYSVLPDGTSLAPLYANPGNEKVSAFGWAPDSTRIAFIAGAAGANDLFLRTVLPAGGGTQLLMASTSGDVRAVSLLWSPDATKIALAGELRAFGLVGAYVAPPAGGMLTFIGPFTTYAGSFTLNPSAYPTLRWSSNGSRLAVQHANNAPDINVSDGNGPGALVTATQTLLQGHAFAPDSTRIAYVGDAVNTGVPEAIVSPSDTTYGSVRVSPPLGVSQGVRDVAWSTDGTLVLYTADVTGYQVRELWASAPDGTAFTLLSGPLTLDGEVIRFAVR
jgi:Tol biopolymer transport system component